MVKREGMSESDNEDVGSCLPNLGGKDRNDTEETEGNVLYWEAVMGFLRGGVVATYIQLPLFFLHPSLFPLLHAIPP